MKKYIKPSMNIEAYDIQDVLSSSGLTVEDVHNIGNVDNIFDEDF